MPKFQQVQKGGGFSRKVEGTDPTEQVPEYVQKPLFMTQNGRHRMSSQPSLSSIHVCSTCWADRIEQIYVQLEARMDVGRGEIDPGAARSTRSDTLGYDSLCMISSTACF
jgi:hypothetical protein